MPQTLQGDAPGTALRRLGSHAKMVGSLDDDLAAERAALHEAIIDALSERATDGTPRWSHQQMLDALEPLVGGQRRPPEPRRPPEDMKGRGTFTTAQAMTSTTPTTRLSGCVARSRKPNCRPAQVRWTRGSQRSPASWPNRRRRRARYSSTSVGTAPRSSRLSEALPRPKAGALSRGSRGAQ